MFFKKKKETPLILTLLENYYKCACVGNKKYFYAIVDDADKPYANNFCKKNHLIMEINCINNDNMVYKFTLQGE